MSASFLIVFPYESRLGRDPARQAQGDLAGARHVERGAVSGKYPEHLRRRIRLDRVQHGARGEGGCQPAVLVGDEVEIEHQERRRQLRVRGEKAFDLGAVIDHVTNVGALPAPGTASVGYPTSGKLRSMGARAGRRAAIAGLGITEVGKVYGRRLEEFAADAVRLAAADAGLAVTDIDGLLVSSGVTRGISIGLAADPRADGPRAAVGDAGLRRDRRGDGHDGVHGGRVRAWPRSSPASSVTRR